MSEAQGWTLIFVLAVATQALVRLWLTSRQIAAVQAHRNRVPEAFLNQVALADQQKAADYTTARARLGRWSTLVDAIALLALTVGGGIAALDLAWAQANLSQPWHGVLVICSVFAILAMIDLPSSLWHTFRIEARFGFNKTTPRLFVADALKGLLLRMSIGIPVLLAALTLMDKAGTWWWVPAWIAWIAFMFTLTWAWPRFIAPFFNRFTPLNDQTLKSCVEALLRRCGFASSGVFVMDGSRRSAHGNAYFTGTGRNKRIVLFDTLLERLDATEVEAVLAHELGHFRLRHIRKRLIASSVASLGALALLAWLAQQPQFYIALGVPTPSSHAALLLFSLALPVFAFFATPIASWWSRRHEFEADDFAADQSDAQALARALVKLYRDNATTLTPDRLHSVFYDSHPQPLLRIARLEASQGAHP